MANNQPTFIVKWIGGIVASVITAYLIVNFINHSVNDKSPDIDAGRGVLTFEQKHGLFKFEYPVFLDKVIEKVSCDQPMASVVAIRRDLHQLQQNIGENGWDNLSFFEKLTVTSGTPDLDEIGMVTIILVPNYVLAAAIATKADNQSASTKADVFAGLDPIAREQVDFGNLPSSGCSQRRTQDYVNLTYLYVGLGASLVAEGRFHKDAWSKHLSEIRRMFGSFNVNEVTSVGWFRSRLKDGSIGHEESEKLSAYLAAISNLQLPEHYQQEKGPDCIEAQ